MIKFIDLKLLYSGPANNVFAFFTVSAIFLFMPELEREKRQATDLDLSSFGD